MSSDKHTPTTRSPANTSGPSKDTFPVSATAEHANKPLPKRPQKHSKTVTSSVSKQSVVPITPKEFSITPFHLATLAHSLSRHEKVTDVNLLDAVNLLERAYGFLQNIGSIYPKSFKDLLAAEGKKTSGIPRILGLIKDEDQLEIRIKAVFANRLEKEAFDREWIQCESKWADKIWYHGGEDEKEVFDDVLYKELVGSICRKLNIESEAKGRSLSCYGPCRSSEEIWNSRVFKGRDEIDIITWACNEGKHVMSALEVQMGLKKAKKER